MNQMLVIGLMSGTSLDGVDVALCRFFGNPVNFEIINAHTFPYPCGIKSRLADAENLSGAALNQLHIDLGRLYGNMINNFKAAFSIKLIDLVASHGHTVFHEPDKKITLQIGHPAFIAVETGNITVGDFRSADVFLGGQGAPLVPIGDRDLFAKYANRLNLGGFANVSFEKEGSTIAFDICPANIPLNMLSEELGYSYDDEGRLAASGQVDQSLLEELNDLDYYKQPAPKSLGREWFGQYFWPIIDKSDTSPINKLRTITEHIAYRISNSFFKGNVLVTGGGAHNKFLIERIKSLTSGQIIIPNNDLINYKEALIFAYLGYLRAKGKANTLPSVTGASKPHCSGGIYFP